MLLTGKRGLDALLAEYGARSSDLPAIAGCYTGGKLVICGDAAGVWSDLEAFGCRSDAGKGGVAKEGWDFLAVNKLGETFPGDVEHWFSNSGTLLARWHMARRVEYEFAAPKHTHALSGPAKWLWPWPAQGTSGCGAVLSGLALGYGRIVLCGMPLDDGPHNGEPHWRRTKFASSEAAGADGGPDIHWQRVIKSFKGRVLSMSGRTREWLGAP